MSDLFSFLGAMNKGDYNYVDSMPESELKKISPYVLLMWCNGATSNTVEHILCTNSFCSDKVFPLAKHKKLLLKLFIAANSGFGNTKYKFKKSVSSEAIADRKLIAAHYNCSLNEAKDYEAILSKEDIEELKEIYK